MSDSKALAHDCSGTSEGGSFLFPSGLVHPLSAVPGSTMARDLVLIVLEIKLVVVRQLLSLRDPAAGNDDNLVFFVKCYNFGDTVGSTGVVGVASRAPGQSGIDHLLVVDAEHVDPPVLELVDLLAPIGHFVAYHGANVFNHHGVLLQILRSVQTQALNARPGQINVILPLGLQASILGRLGVDELLAVRRVELSGEGALVGLGHAGAV